MLARKIDEFDELKLYFGEEYPITDQITIFHPTLGEIIDMGEKEYFHVIQTLTCIPSDMKSVLWDMGVDYDTISDFDLFRMMAPTLKPEQSYILFHDTVDFSKMRQYKNEKTDQIVLADIENNIIIDEYVYLKIVLYLRKMHSIKPKVEHAGTKNAKQIMILLDRQDREKAKSKPYSSRLFPLISSLLNSPGFKYQKKDLKQVHYYEFMDCAKRISALKSADALLQGVYAGNVDVKKLSNGKKELDGFRDLSENT